MTAIRFGDGEQKQKKTKKKEKKGRHFGKLSGARKLH